MTPRRTERRGGVVRLPVLLVLIAGPRSLATGCRPVVGLVVAATPVALSSVALLTAALRFARLLTPLAAAFVPSLIGLARLILRAFIAAGLGTVTLRRTALLAIPALHLPLVVLVLVSHRELHVCWRKESAGGGC